MKKVLFLHLVIFGLLVNLSFGQDATATIGTITTCHNTTVSVTVIIENFINVGAVSLYIGYDTAQLNFVGLENINPAFQGLLYNDMNIPSPQIGISWTSLSGVNVVSGVFFQMKFNYQDNSTDLLFNPGCEVTTPDLEPIEVIFDNGQVNPIITILQNPESITVISPSQASFSITSSGGGAFLWQQSTNNGASFSDLTNSGIYQGVNTQELILTGTNQFLNGSYYRCKITSGQCVKYSESALLTLETTAQQNISLVAGWNSLSSYLNPINPNLNVLFSSIINSIEIVTAENGYFYPDGNINTIGSFDPTKGYAIKLSENKTLSISGSKLVNTQLVIPSGWSYLPVIVDCDVAIEALFGASITEVDFIKEIPGLSVYWPAFNIKTLLTLNPGKSYLIKMKNSVETTFPVCN